MRRNTTSTAKRLRMLAAALLLAALALVPSSGTALAQQPPDQDSPIVLVNEDKEFIDRKDDGRFIARPVFDRELPALYYGVRDGDTGEWIAPMYRVRGDAKERRDGFEYSFEYPFEDGQTELDPERPYLLVIIARSWAEETRPFYAVIPPHQPRRPLEQGAGRARPRALGQGDRPLDDRGRARDALRRRRARRRRRCRGVRGHPVSDIFTGTPPGLTYDHEIVRQAWMAVWVITSGALVVIIGWMGLSLIVGDHLGRAQAGWRELVPRLGLGLVAAAASLWWCALVIDVADAVSGFIAAELGVTAGDMLRSTLRTLLTAVAAGSVGMALLLALIYLAYAFFVLYLVVQMVLRLALIDILLALAPIALGLWILPHTAGWGRHWLRLFMTTVFQQAIQLVALALGIGFLNEYAAIGGGDAMQDLAWKLLMSLAFIYLATRVPSMLGNSGTFDAWLHTLYFGMSLPGSLMRSARSVGLLAGGGAAGGPVGAAVAAGAAGGLASAATSGVRSAAETSTPSTGSGGPGAAAPRSSSE